MLFPVQKVAGDSRQPLNFPVERITDSILALSDMCVLLTDRDTGVMYCSKSVFTVLGVSRESVMESGWSVIKKQIHPCDQVTLEKKLFPSLGKYLRALPNSQKDSHNFSFTLRAQHVSGKPLLLAFENKPMTWSDGHWPQVFMSVIKNITPFGNRQKMLLAVSKRDTSRTAHSVVHREEFDFRWPPFTSREVEITRLIAMGRTSKEIAFQLFLSPETVRNHRKNILRKSGCASSSELSAFACKVRMI
jgi:DNA-binding CsgD family transcriptional regulator